MADPFRTARRAGLMAAVLLVLAGCSEDEDRPLDPEPEGNQPDSSLPFPDTPDQLMANFQTIYETMDAEEYELILDPAFETILQDRTIQDFPQVGQRLDEAEENRIHERLFSGENLTDRDGDSIPAILQFSFSRFQPLVDWGVSLPTDPVPNTLSALYDVEILADRGPSYPTFKIEGQIRFYAAPAEGLHFGEPRTYFRLVGQLDLTQNNKATENKNWGSLKAWYY